MEQLAVLAHVYRGATVDNLHRGAVAVVDLSGQVQFALGDPDYRAFIRSAGKPLQALALVEMGGMETFGLSDAELAIVCGSHSGGALQVQTVRGLLDKIGVDESALRAGAGIEDNCSGKHAGMLALAKLQGHSTAGYSEANHPIQVLIMERVSAMCELPPDELILATDGCGAPIYAMPLRNMALGYARLSNPDHLSTARAQAARRTAHAMQNHPQMTGGIDFRTICDGKVVAKSGASGCFCAGFPGQGLGFAMKVADGSSVPVLPVFFEVARRLGLIEEDEFARFARIHPSVAKNRRGEIVGDVRIAF